MPLAKHNSIMDKASGLITLYFFMSLSLKCEMQQPQYMHHRPTFVLLGVPFHSQLYTTYVLVQGDMSWILVAINFCSEQIDSRDTSSTILCL